MPCGILQCFPGKDPSKINACTLLYQGVLESLSAILVSRPVALACMATCSAVPLNSQESLLQDLAKVEVMYELHPPSWHVQKYQIP